MEDDGFRLQFDPAEIPALAERYGPGEDDDALAAGRRIRGGARSRQDFEKIVWWKSRRVKPLIKKNTNQKIVDALNVALSAPTDRAAFAALTGLHGVAVPVASAILTAIYPTRYTVIDFRALQALGSESKNRTVDFYLVYLKACRRGAKTHRVKLRTLDRALWQWSKECGR